MHEATLTVDPPSGSARSIPRLYGSFVEHMGRCVYTGIFEPGHPTADDAGFRADVADLVRELGVPVCATRAATSSPATAGRTASGRSSERPTRLDLAWRSLETNQVGVDEFVPWCQVGRQRADDGGQPRHPRRRRGPEPGRVLQRRARHAWSDLRRHNGAADPHGDQALVPGQRDGRAVADRAQDRRRVRRGWPPRPAGRCAGSIRRSSWSCAAAPMPRMPTFGDVGAHRPRRRPTTSSTTSRCTATTSSAATTGPASWPARWTWTGSSRRVVATCDHVRAVGRHRSASTCRSTSGTSGTRALRRRGEPGDQQAPHLIEDTYSVDRRGGGRQPADLDAPARRPGQDRLPGPAGQRHRADPDRAGGPAWRQTTFHPFALTSRHGRGTVLRAEPVGPGDGHGGLRRRPALDAAATLDERAGTVTVFAVNRDQHRAGGALGRPPGAARGSSSASTPRSSTRTRTRSTPRPHPDRVRPAGSPTYQDPGRPARGGAAADRPGT